MKKNILITLFALVCNMTFAQRTIFVAPDGSDSGDGSKEQPWLSIQKALDEVEPGGTVYLREGTYYPAKRLCPPRKITSAEKRITIASYQGERAVIDGSKMTPASVNEFKGSRCLYLTYWCDYYYIKDIDFCNALDNGVKVEGSFNIFENCRFHHNNDTGLQIGMFKDWKIEEHNGFYDINGKKITGTPEFNPGYRFCRGNKVINCDSWANADVKAYGGGSDDGGDADGFACKLFPGPGTEFYGCRAWINSDDNWDLYMVYHPVVIDHCWAYKGGYTEAGKLIGNGNGFKMGGGGTSGGAAFSQSVGAHILRNCVAFDNGHKGFDQNNAYEGMYVLNCTGWGNEYNYRFPTIFMYGGMYIRNCVGFNATKLNHEFLSEDKEGSVVPNTDFNSWTTLDGCYPYKDGKKNGGKENVWAKDYSAEFLSLSVEDFMAERQPDGSLPDNNFAKLKEGSVLIDKGTLIENFVPARFMTEAEANGLELITAHPFSLPFLGDAPDFGAMEYGLPAITTPDSVFLLDSLLFVEQPEPTEPVEKPETHTLGAADQSGWYQFQTSLYDLPADLEGLVDINYDNADQYGRQFSETGATDKTFWDPNWIESGYSNPLLSSKGACNIGSGSALEWTLPSCYALKLNVFTTGSRAFTIYYKREGVDTNWVKRDIGSMSKGSYQLDILSLADIEPCETPIEIRFECSSKSSKMLGARVWDMYVEVFGKADSSTDGIQQIVNGQLSDGQLSVYLTETVLVVQGADIRDIALFSASGKLVAQSRMSGLCNTSHLTPGIYMAQITTCSGQKVVKKVFVMYNKAS